MNSFMEAELQACCASLGSFDGVTYLKEPDCIESIKDLIRYLRREDDTHPVRRILNQAAIVQNDLLHIIKNYSADKELFDISVRLMVNLTTPAVIIYGGKMPTDILFVRYYIELETSLIKCKELCADESLFLTIGTKLKDILEMDWDERSEEDETLIERILLLVRNILHVPTSGDEKRTDDDVSTHDQILWAVHTSGFDELIKYIACCEDERRWCMHIIEIISYMFRDQEAAHIANAGLIKTESQRIDDQKELQQLRLNQQSLQQNSKTKLKSRHPRFGGTFVMRNLKSLNDSESIIYHGPIPEDGVVSVDQNKESRPKPKRSRPLTDCTPSRRSTLSVRYFLKEFCVEFLDNCYNPIMHWVKDNLVRHKAQSNDETYYLWTMRFFMEFNRLHKFRVDVVSETLNIQMFHYIEVQIQNYYDMMQAEKKDFQPWGRRMYLALQSFNELLLNVQTMGLSKDKTLIDSANVIKNNIFYVAEYRDLFPFLMKKYDDSKMTISFLMTLVEATHVFVKMLENFCHKRQTLVVREKAAKKRRRSKKKVENTEVDSTVGRLDEIWDLVSSELSALLQGRSENPIPEVVTPFDASSDVPIDDQKEVAVARLQTLLREGRGAEGLALYRASREVWPSGEIFGNSETPPETEFMSLREIFYTEISTPVTTGPISGGSLNPPEVELTPLEELEQEDESEGEPVFTEKQFHLNTYIKTFAHAQVVMCYNKLLTTYKMNAAVLNHSVVKMLHRICVDCKMYPMLFQLSVFRNMQHILNDPTTKSIQYKELVTFCEYIVRKFMQLTTSNPLLFAEILFWKGPKDAYEISEGYGNYSSENKQSDYAPLMWTNEEQVELEELYTRFKNCEGDKDTVDYIIENITDVSRTRKKIIRQLVKQDLIDNERQFQKEKGYKRPALWRDDHITELRKLLETHRLSENPIVEILNGMTVKKSKPKVIDKLMELGLISDRKGLSKKRHKKTPKKKTKKKSGLDFLEANKDLFENNAEGVPSSPGNSDTGETTDNDSITEDVGAADRNSHSGDSIEDDDLISEPIHQSESLLKRSRVHSDEQSSDDDIDTVLSRLKDPADGTPPQSDPYGDVPDTLYTHTSPDQLQSVSSNAPTYEIPADSFTETVLSKHRVRSESDDQSSEDDVTMKAKRRKVVLDSDSD